MASILVVDDSPVDRQLAAGLLAKESDWSVRQFEGAQTALNAIQVASPDLVVTDLQMPELSGLDLVVHVRKNFPQVPVILMTGKGSEELAVEALHSGAASYVPKRLLATQLVETVRRVLNLSSEDRFRVDLAKRIVERRDSYLIGNEVNLLLSLSRHIQQSLGDAWGIDRTDRMRIGTALEEALLNALYHGNLDVSSQLKEEDHDAFYRLADQRKTESPWKDRRIHVTVRLSATELEVAIRDEGKGFDPTKLPDPTDPENLDRPCGRGVMLMRAFMDEVSYNQTGNQVTLIRRRKPD